MQLLPCSLSWDACPWNEALLCGTPSHIERPYTDCILAKALAEVQTRSQHNHQTSKSGSLLDESRTSQLSDLNFLKEPQLRTASLIPVNP